MPTPSRGAGRQSRSCRVRAVAATPKPPSKSTNGSMAASRPSIRVGAWPASGGRAPPHRLVSRPASDAVYGSLVSHRRATPPEGDHDTSGNAPNAPWRRAEGNVNPKYRSLATWLRRSLTDGLPNRCRPPNLRAVAAPLAAAQFIAAAQQSGPSGRWSGWRGRGGRPRPQYLPVSERYGPPPVLRRS
jgi:hypothetical protein